MKIAFDIRGIEGDRGWCPFFVIAFFLFFSLYPFQFGLAASSSVTLSFPEMISCQTNSYPLKQSSLSEGKGFFLLKPVIRACDGSGEIIAYMAPLSLVNKEVAVVVEGDFLTQRMIVAKALGLQALPVSDQADQYQIKTDFNNIRDKLNTGNYCLLIFEASKDKVCINMYNSFKDDRSTLPFTGDHRVYSYQTASIGDFVIDAFAFALRPYTLSAVEYWYYGAEYYLRPQGLNISADFLEYSLLDEPENLEFEEGSEVAEKIRGSEKYRAALKIVEKSIYDGKFTSDDLGEAITLIFESGDLLTSIKKANLEYEAVQTDEGYNVSVTITDDYDFHPLWKAYKSKFFLTLMNNTAFLNQYLGVIHNYSIKIEMQEYIPLNDSENE